MNLVFIQRILHFANGGILGDRNTLSLSYMIKTIPLVLPNFTQLFTVVSSAVLKTNTKCCLEYWSQYIGWSAPRILGIFINISDRRIGYTQAQGKFLPSQGCAILCVNLLRQNI